jgi:TctA family transporter
VPLLMGTTSAELLGLCIMGLAMVAALSGGSMIKGLGAAAVGIMLAFIGDEPTTAVPRWTFGSLYLSDGINLLVIALGIYALPEVADMAIQGRSIASEKAAKTGVMTGARRGLLDTLRNWKLVSFSSLMSTILGALPAVGPTIIPWMVYAMATKFTRGASMFGKGDVRGVIASESSNNATVGGALLPTVAVGVPGSAPMALFLGGMLLHGVAPGPDMLSKNLSLTYMMVWAIVLANMIGGAVAFALAGSLVKVVFVRASVLVPLISSVLVVGAVQSSRQWQDLAFLLLIGAIGWAMKQGRWSRAPMFLAFILAPLIERYFHISTNLHGSQWIYRPAVAVMLVLTVLFLLGVAVSHVGKSMRRWERGPRQFKPFIRMDVVFALCLLACTAVAWTFASRWPADARMLPQVATGTAALMALLAVLMAWWVPVRQASVGPAAPDEMNFDLESDFGGMSHTAIARQAAKYLGLLIAFALLAWAVGVVPAIPAYVFACLLLYGERWLTSGLIAVLAGVFCEVVFNRVLSLAWPPALWPLW